MRTVSWSWKKGYRWVQVTDTLGRQDTIKILGYTAGWINPGDEYSELELEEGLQVGVEQP
jgi:hypothetical protein